MKKYKFTFIGRKVGAIGKTYKIVSTVTAENIDSAKLSLYDNYEHIQILKIV